MEFVFFRFRLKLIIARQRFHPKKTENLLDEALKVHLHKSAVDDARDGEVKIGYDDISWSMLTNPTLDDNL